MKLQDIEVPKVNAFKYLESIAQDDGGADIEIGRRISAAWHGWRKITGVLCDRRVSNWVKKDSILQRHPLSPSREGTVRGFRMAQLCLFLW